MSSLAKKYGFHDPDVLHSHADNAQLKNRRSNPNVLCKGDKVIIPEKEEKTEQGSDAQRHMFRAKGLRTHLRFLIEDFEGNSYSNKSYKLEVGTESFEGKTNGEGLVEHRVLSGETRGKLTVWLDDKKTSSMIWPLEIGALEPHEEARGIQARLNNLGFTCGKVDGIIGPKTLAAMKAFKKKNGLADNDTIDDPTKNKLKEVYGF